MGMEMSEHSEQCVVVDWLNCKHIKFYAIPNGGQRNVVVASKLKAEGVKAGVPDLCIPVPTGGYHGMYVEMKVKPNKPTKEQREWKDYFDSVGYATAVCYGADEAIREIERYFKHGRENMRDVRL